MKARLLKILILLSFLTGCTQARSSSTPTIAPSPTLGAVSVGITPAPDANLAARKFLDAWKTDDYASMYAMLTSVSRDAISQEDFEKHFSGITSEMALSGIEYEILSSLVASPESAQVGYRMHFQSALVDDLVKDTKMNLSLESGQWRVQWDDTLVMPELAGGNYLGMERFIPARANIYDRNGEALVAQTDATAIGLVPGQIDPEQEETLFTWLERLTGQRADDIRARYASFPAGADWYLPLGEVPSDLIAKNFDFLSGLSGLQLNSNKWRYYFDGGVAPHVVGYVTTIQQGQEEEYRRKGYRAR